MYKELVDYLVPVLGEATAANLVRHYCTRMRLPVEEVKPVHLPELARAMRPMLAVWLGSSGASPVAAGLAELGKGAKAG